MESRRLTKTWLAGLAALFCLLPAAGCGGKGNGEKRQAAGGDVVPVLSGVAAAKTVPIQLKLIGTVEAIKSVTVKTMVGGELIEVPIRDGDVVSAGQVLFQIDPRPYLASLAQATANMEKDMAQVRQAEANLGRNKAQLANAERDLKRYEELLAKGAASRQTVDQLRTQCETLQAAYAADAASLDLAREVVKTDRASIESIKIQLGYCTLRSPMAGRAGNILLQKGNVVKSNDTSLLTINQMTPIYVSCNVPEQRLQELVTAWKGGTLKISAEIPGQGAPLEGEVTFIDNAVDRATGTIKLKGVFENTENRLWPGQYVNVVLTLSQRDNAVTVPTPAIQTGQQGQYVYVIKPDMTVEPRTVKPGPEWLNETIVEEGVRPGEKVVVDGQLRLAPGRKVSIKPGLSGK